MGLQVVNGAACLCTFGTAPSTLTITPANSVNAANQPAATIMDNIPMENIMPFGQCTSMSNPQVASATASAGGVLQPQSCMPVIPAPWTPGKPTSQLKNMPLLDNASMVTCAWGGVISITSPGQTSVTLK